MPSLRLSDSPGLSALSRVIIAGGSDDISAQDMIDWISPVLEGITDGLWLSAELNPSDRGQINVKLRNGRFARHLILCRLVARQRARPVLELMPAAGPTAVVMLNDHAPQVMTLLDGMASWLYIFEAEDPQLTPLMALLSDCATLESGLRKHA